MGGIRRIGAMTLAVVLGVGLTACGGGDDDAEAGTTTTEAATDDTTADDSGSDGADASDLLGGDCAAFAEAFANAGEASGSALSGDDAGLEEAAAFFSEVADQVPDEIADDFEVFANAYAEFAQAMADADIDLSNPSAADPEAMAELQTIMESFSSDEVQEASNNITAYMSEHCTAG